MNEHISGAYKELMQLREKLHHLSLTQWKQESMFTWEWWLLVGLTVIPLIIWWKTVDKKRAYEIAFYGCMINIFALILDDLGTNLLWWGYPIGLIPVMPPLLTADSILVPIIFMMVYQKYSVTGKLLFISNVVTGAFVAFVAEPIFVWVGYYQLLKWNFIYSFLFYILATSLARLIIVKIK
jgi:hypothetical protein